MRLRRIAERIRRAVTALEPDLMRSVAVRELDKEVLIEAQPAVLSRIGLDHGRRNAGLIELVVPRGIQGVRPMSSPAVAAYFAHLGPPPVIAAARVPAFTRDPANVDRT